MDFRVYVLLLVLILVGCGKTDLSRDGAAKLIQSDKRLIDYGDKLKISNGAIESGLRQGLWERGNRTEIILTSKAAIDIKSVDDYWLIPAKPQQITVEVTGIADLAGSDKSKEVRFTWTYANLPSNIKRMVTNGGTGSGLFRLFDDGWRLDAVNITVSKDAIALSAAEVEQVKSDIQVVEQKKQDIRELLAKSWTQTKNVKTFNFERVQDRGTKYGTQNIEITDVDVSYFDMGGKRQTVWFGMVNEIAVGFRGNVQLVHKNAGHYIYGRPDMNSEEVVASIRSAVAAWRQKYPRLPAEARSLYLASRR